MERSEDPEERDDPGGTERFELRGQLGVGSSGTVYRVLDRERGHEVALKVLRRFGGAELYRFKREFRSLAGIHHPNLATLHELYLVADEWMYTMELVDGEPFDRWVRPDDGSAHGRLDVDRLRTALAQLADGLTALHALGKIHRDLKPTNVLVEPGGRVVILDFGLVVDATRTDRTHDGRAIGTLAYMSPEQGADLPLGPASDWYAVGAMLYEALCGVPPFRGDARDVLLRRQLEDPPAPSKLADGVPPDLEALCLRLLARAPERRPDGKAVMAALGIEPSPASRALASRPAPRALPAAAVSALRQAVADSRDHFVTVVVRGPSGSGKSALCDQVLEEAEARQRALVLTARLDGRERSHFPAFDQIVDQLGTLLLALPAEQQAALAPLALPLARVFPTLRRVPLLRVPALPGAASAPEQVLERALDAFRAIMARFADERPVVLVIDGAEHTTPMGGVVFQRLLARPALPPVLQVVTLRSAPEAGHLALDAIRAWGERGGDLRWIELDRAG